MFKPVCEASCSRICRVGFGVSEKACFSVSSCFALIVVRGPLLLVPGVFSSLPAPLVPGAVAADPFVKEVLALLFVPPTDPSVPFGEPAQSESVSACPESESDEDADIGDDLEERPISDPDPPDEANGGKPEWV